MVTEGSAEALRISGVGTTTIDITADAVCLGEPLSFAVAVKLNVPLTVGVPEITPVLLWNANPAGRLPDVIDQV